MFYDNYVRLCARIKKSPTAAAADCGISGATVTKWKKGAVPFDSTLRKLADYFGVTVEELLAEKEKPVTKGNGLSEDEAEVVNLYRHASPDTRAAMLNLLRSVSVSQSSPGVGEEAK